MTAPARAIVDHLLPWYGRSARDLPWRRTPTPYRVLLSELMLQQTRVDTVVPYFERFLARWPTVEALAAAEIDEVLHAWAGLGYYSRARNLHKCAVAAAARGGIPGDVPGLLALPGVGPYTAGAVASIAFGVRAPLVDGNVERVLCRVDADATAPRSADGKRALWARAAGLQHALLPGERAGDLNQALMELGATVCSPKSPACDRCPLGGLCAAAALGGPERFPSKIARARPVPITAVYGLGWNGGWILGQRPAGLLGGMWEPIGQETQADEDPAQVLVQAFADRAGLVADRLEPAGEVRHVFSHRALTALVYRVQVAGTPVRGGFYTDVRAVDEPGALPLSKLARKLLATVEKRA